MGRLLIGLGNLRFNLSLLDSLLKARVTLLVQGLGLLYLGKALAVLTEDRGTRHRRHGDTHGLLLLMNFAEVRGLVLFLCCSYCT